MICSHCGAEGAFPKGSFGAVCEGCGRYLHSCSQCRLYVVSTRRCISSTSEQPADPVHRNFCEEFEPLNAKRDGGEAAGSDEARSKFLDLFGGKG